MCDGQSACHVIHLVPAVRLVAEHRHGLVLVLVVPHGDLSSMGVSMGRRGARAAPGSRHGHRHVRLSTVAADVGGSRRGGAMLPGLASSAGILLGSAGSARKAEEDASAENTDLAVGVVLHRAGRIVDPDARLGRLRGSASGVLRACSSGRAGGRSVRDRRRDRESVTVSVLVSRGPASLAGRVRGRLGCVGSENREAVGVGRELEASCHVHLEGSSPRHKVLGRSSR